MSPAATGHSIQRSVSAAPDVFHNATPSRSFASPMDPVAVWTATQRAMSTSPGPATLAQHASFATATPPQTAGMPFPQVSSAPTVDRRGSLPAAGAPGAGPYDGGSLPPHAAYQGAPQEILPPMPEPQSIVHASPSLQQYAAPPPQPQSAPYSGGGGAPSIAGLATIEEDGESQAGTVKTLQKLPTIGKTSPKGANGNSVSRNNIEHFEAMAEAEEDEEEVKRQMIAMGMQPDDDAFASTERKSQVEAAKAPAQAPESVRNASTGRRTEASHASSAGTYRPKASDIFQLAATAELSGSPPAVPAQKRSEQLEPSMANLERSQPLSLHVTEIKQTSETRTPAARSVVSLRRSSSSQGIGLQALETNLVRSTTPKITTMANVARADSSSSPLASAPAVFDDSTRSRKNSALRAAALAREEAERKSAEEQVRAAVARERQVQAEQVQKAAAAEKEYAQKEAATLRAAEQQKLEREGIAERARQQRELREQQEKQRLKAEAERIQREEDMKRQEQDEMKRRSRKETEAEAAAAAVAIQAQAVSEPAKESRHLANIPAIDNNKTAGSIAPCVPSKTTAPILAAPSRTSDQDRIALKQQAVHRIDGWLSKAASPNPSHMNSPGTPSASVLSVMRKEEPDVSALRVAEARSPSRVINPLWEGESSRSPQMGSAMPKSRTMADLASSKLSAAAAEASQLDEEPIPQLSAELRALVDGR